MKQSLTPYCDPGLSQSDSLESSYKSKSQFSAANKNVIAPVQPFFTVIWVVQLGTSELRFILSCSCSKRCFAQEDCGLPGDECLFVGKALISICDVLLGNGFYLGWFPIEYVKYLSLQSGLPLAVGLLRTEFSSCFCLHNLLPLPLVTGESSSFLVELLFVDTRLVKFGVAWYLGFNVRGLSYDSGTLVTPWRKVWLLLNLVSSLIGR